MQAELRTRLRPKSTNSAACLLAVDLPPNRTVRPAFRYGRYRSFFRRDRTDRREDATSLPEPATHRELRRALRSHHRTARSNGLGRCGNHQLLLLPRRAIETPTSCCAF